MATEVYIFHVTYEGQKDRIWRKIEVSSNYRLDQLGYLVLSAFDIHECHPFNIFCDGVRFSIPFEDDYRQNLDMTIFKLNQLGLKEGSLILIDYSNKGEYSFSLKFVERRNMLHGQGRRFPVVIDGAGLSDIEDCSLVKLTEKVGQHFQEKPFEICKSFNIKAINASLKYNIDMIEERYAQFRY